STATFTFLPVDVIGGFTSKSNVAEPPPGIFPSITTSLAGTSPPPTPTTSGPVYGLLLLFETVTRSLLPPAVSTALRGTKSGAFGGGDGLTLAEGKGEAEGDGCGVLVGSGAGVGVTS